MGIKYLKDIPGSLVWLIILTSAGGFIISWFIGAKLPERDYNIRENEATLKKELTYEEDDQTENTAIDVLIELVEKNRHNSYRLFTHLFYFDLWRNLFSKIIIILPLIIIGRSLFSGLIT